MKFKVILALFFAICLVNFASCTNEGDDDAEKQAIAAPNDDSAGVQGNFYDSKSYESFVQITVFHFFQI